LPSREGTGGGRQALRARSARARPCPHPRGCTDASGTGTRPPPAAPATQQAHAVATHRGLPQPRARARARADCPPTTDRQPPLAQTRHRQRPRNQHRHIAPHTRAPQRHTRTGKRRRQSSTVPPPPLQTHRTPGQLRCEMTLQQPARRTRCDEPTRTDNRDNRPPHNNNNPPWRVSNDQNAHQQPRTTENHTAQWCAPTPTRQPPQNAKSLRRQRYHQLQNAKPFGAADLTNERPRRPPRNCMHPTITQSCGCVAETDHMTGSSLDNVRHTNRSRAPPRTRRTERERQLDPQRDLAVQVSNRYAGTCR
jgi:hypothetical protein